MPTVLLAAALICVTPAAADLTVGGGWRVVNGSEQVGTGQQEPREKKGFRQTPLGFLAPPSNLTDSALTVGYALPAFGTFLMNVDPEGLARIEQDGTVIARNQSIDMYATYSAALFGGEVGVFGRVNDSRGALNFETGTSRTVGASVGYAGFYLRGAYQDAALDTLVYGSSAWQAGLGYGSSEFDVRVTYMQSAFLQGSTAELEGKKWMIGGLLQVTPSILINANAFYINRDLTVPTIDPPGAGARVGLQLRF